MIAGYQGSAGQERIANSRCLVARPNQAVEVVGVGLKYNVWLIAGSLHIRSSLDRCIPTSGYRWLQADEPCYWHARDRKLSLHISVMPESKP